MKGWALMDPVENALDDDDLDLVAALQRAPRAPLSLLAQALGVSASTVGRRLARLESHRLLRVIGQVDLSVSGEGTPWHVWVTAAPDGPTTSPGGSSHCPRRPMSPSPRGRRTSTASSSPAAAPRPTTC
ncbi:AsnC family transcriptional regulator [Streptomyces purpurascens]